MKSVHSSEFPHGTIIDAIRELLEAGQPVQVVADWNESRAHDVLRTSNDCAMIDLDGHETSVREDNVYGIMVPDILHKFYTLKVNKHLYVTREQGEWAGYTLIERVHSVTPALIDMGFGRLATRDDVLSGAVKLQNQAEFEAENPHTEDDEEDHYEVKCTRCGDGGCPSCEPKRFY